MLPRQAPPATETEDESSEPVHWHREGENRTWERSPARPQAPVSEPASSSEVAETVHFTIDPSRSPTPRPSPTESVSAPLPPDPTPSQQAARHSKPTPPPAPLPPPRLTARLSPRLPPAPLPPAPLPPKATQPLSPAGSSGPQASAEGDTAREMEAQRESFRKQWEEEDSRPWSSGWKSFKADATDTANSWWHQPVTASSSGSWTSQSWWTAEHTPDSAWVKKRKARAAAYQSGQMPVPDQCGPVAVHQDCMRCHRNHHAMQCERAMCGNCCLGHPKGACLWHRRNAALLAGR